MSVSDLSSKDSSEQGQTRGESRDDAQADALEPVEDGFRARLRYGKGLRGRFVIALHDRQAATRRYQRLRVLADLLASAGHSAEAPIILRKAAAVQSERDFSEAVRVAEELCMASPTALKKLRASIVTFEMLGREWSSGALHRKWPDHVKLKSSANKDEGRLQFLYATIGSIRLDAFTLEDAERAMEKLDENASTATRRHYAQLISKVLKLAVYPCRIIERSPLPEGFLPKVKNTKATAYLYPAEDAQLVGSAAVPLVRRAFYGFLAREGCRAGEALALRWSDLDLERGAVRLDRNKTDDPRAWALSDGVPEALAALRPEGATDTDLVFAGVDPEHMADTFRADLEAAGVKRSELFERSKQRRPIRLHDLRATFVTLSLAAGKSEAWVSDRTGHRSSVMINRYRRAARTAAELGLGSLQPLGSAMGTSPPTREPSPGPQGGPGNTKAPWRNGIRRRLKSRPESARTDAQASKQLGDDTRSDVKGHEGPGDEVALGHDLADVDIVERALAEALVRASRDGAHDVVKAIVDELKARRQGSGLSPPRS